MRNWPYAYAASEKKGGPALQGDVGVTLLPKGPGENTHQASTLGGWQLMVNTASEGKKKTAAIRFVKFLTRKDTQLSLAKDTGRVPALTRV
jgi:trehalose/maltose transport system substrate-binding protein